MAGKRKQATRGRSGPPAWALLLIGLVAGAALASWVFLAGYGPTLRSKDKPVAEPDAELTQPSEPGIAEQADDKQTYDFYTVLPEREVVIPDEQLSARARKETDKPSQPETSSTSSGKYLLQTGSFPSAGDADALKARLALQGFTAHIETVTINGKTWHRVRLGPYSSAAKLETVKDKLQTKGIHALAMKVN